MTEPEPEPVPVVHVVRATVERPAGITERDVYLGIAAVCLGFALGMIARAAEAP